MPVGALNTYLEVEDKGFELTQGFKILPLKVSAFTFNL